MRPGPDASDVAELEQLLAATPLIERLAQQLTAGI
jgi:hypothetical protein